MRSLHTWHCLGVNGLFFNGTAVNPIDAIDADEGNMCRCSGYSGIKRAIIQLSECFDSS